MVPAGNETVWFWKTTQSIWYGKLLTLEQNSEIVEASNEDVLKSGRTRDSRQNNWFETRNFESHYESSNWSSQRLFPSTWQFFYSTTPRSLIHFALSQDHRNNSVIRFRFTGVLGNCLLHLTTCSFVSSNSITYLNSAKLETSGAENQQQFPE